MNAFFRVLAVCLLSTPLMAQGAEDFLRSTGKIYSVVVVICILFLGIAVFLYRLDRKITNLENQIKHEQ